MKIGSKRRITQVFALIVFNLGFFRILKTGFLCPSLYCYGCPFSLFACPIGVLQNFVTFRQVPFFTLGSLGVYGMLAGRVFCGWACPFGALHDLVSYLKGEKSFKVPRYWYIKYVVLFVVLAFAWITLDTVFCKFCPSGSLFAAIPFFILHPDSSFDTFFYVHIFTLIATLILAYLIAHFWCRYLCPLGAIHGIFNKVSLLNIRFDDKKCTECEVCLEVCPMGIDRVHDVGRSTDCTMCGRCVEKCPEKALSFVMK